LPKCCARVRRDLSPNSSRENPRSDRLYSRQAYFPAVFRDALPPRKPSPRGSQAKAELLPLRGRGASFPDEESEREARTPLQGDCAPREVGARFCFERRRSL